MQQQQHAQQQGSLKSTTGLPDDVAGQTQQPNSTLEPAEPVWTPGMSLSEFDRLYWEWTRPSREQLVADWVRAAALRDALPAVELRDTTGQYPAHQQDQQQQQQNSDTIRELTEDNLEI
jgi:hypothetical protein